MTIVPALNLRDYGWEVPPSKSTGAACRKTRTWVECPQCRSQKVVTYVAFLTYAEGEVCYKCRCNTPGAKAQRSRQSRAAWEDPKYREAGHARSQARFQSQAHRELVSSRNRASYAADPEAYLRDKTAALKTEAARAAHVVALADPGYREVHRKLAKERFLDEDYKARVQKGLERFASSGSLSKPEEKMEEVLTSLNMAFTRQKAVGPYRVDYFVPDQKTFVEVQGEYWHTRADAARRDASKYAYLRSAYPDHRVVYVWDYEFLTPGRVAAKFGSAPCGIDPFSLHDLVMEETGVVEARRFFGTWHYAQFGRAASQILGFKLGGETIGMVKFAPVSRQGVPDASLGQTSRNTSELDRFCLHPARQIKNAGSFCISRAARHFFRAFPEKQFLLSFADETFGHSGVIYRASGWEYLGESRPSYQYRDTDGWMLNKKALYNQARECKMTEREYAEARGWTKVQGLRKHKFMKRRP